VEASLHVEKHSGAHDQVWAIIKRGVTTLQAAELPYSVINGPMQLTKNIQSISKWR